MVDTVEAALTIDKSIENELSVLLDQVIDVAKDSAGANVSVDRWSRHNRTYHMVNHFLNKLFYKYWMHESKDPAEDADSQSSCTLIVNMCCSVHNDNKGGEGGFLKQ